MNLLTVLNRDENGFVVSAELVLIGTILVLGLTELSFGVNKEPEDVGSAIGSISQTYYFTVAGGHKGAVAASSFVDYPDECDNQNDVICDHFAQP